MSLWAGVKGKYSYTPAHSHKYAVGPSFFNFPGNLTLSGRDNFI